ncbi:YkvA family protein [Pseudoduganella sp. UC29_71]|uniref:YkvA family protein n=1 Tax=Pseudoduganella sp. UC29_71 TaxID=3350174 RepID=UPI003672C1A7
MSDTNYGASYSDDSFWVKVKHYAKAAGEGVLTPALKMYYAATDADTPLWAKTAIYGALGYFISPIDAIPDIVPLAGYTDDLGVLTAAIAATAAHIKDEHVEKARTTLAQWFS